MNDPAHILETKKLATRLRSLALAAWSIVAAFGTYFCMYGYRKPFTVGTYTDVALWGIGYKTVLVTSQVLGYMVSKFIGIKVIAEMRPEQRAVGILVLIGVAQTSLLLFGLVPPPWNFIPLFLNGIPLGMVFGLVIGFLEGRRHTEALVAGLCASFILADGVAKSVGAELLKGGVGEYWMPFCAGLVFAVPLLVFVWMLTKIPPPSAEDVAFRSERLPMTGVERWDFFKRYAPGLTALVLAYLLITILRSIRADFAPEIWKGLGVKNPPEIYTQSETLVMLGVVLINGSCFVFLDNRKAFFMALAISIGGLVLVGIASISLWAGLNGFVFMVLVGLGLYIPYVAVHTTIFERLIALSRDRANVGYLMYLVDAFGYLGYVAVMLAREVVGKGGNMFAFFRDICLGSAVIGGLLFGSCWIYFAIRRQETVALEPAVA